MFSQSYFRFVILLLDNYDSFTYNLKDYLLQNHVEVEVVRNDEISIAEIEDMDIEGIVLSPGPGEPQNAGIMMECIEHFEQKLPIFGVCLGMQAIGMYYGAELKRAVYPMHGKVSKLTFNKHPLFEGIDELEVCRYHSLVIEMAGAREIEAIAWSDIGEIMAISHKHLAIAGVQFHPEAILTPKGKTIMSNWIKHITLQSKSL